MKKTLLIFSLLFFTQIIIAGGPWPQKKGKGYFKLSEWWTVFDQHYTDSGLIDPNLTTGLFNTSLYAEYGITDRLTGTFNGVLFGRNYNNNLRSLTNDEIIVEGDALNSFGDIELTLNYGLTNPSAKIPISLSLTLGLPTGKSIGGRLNNLQTGDGEFNQMILAHIGKGLKLGGQSAYLSSSIGINNRTNNFSEEFRFNFEAGIGLVNNKFWLNGRLNLVESFKNGATAENITSTSVFANNSEYLSLGLEANLYLSSKVGFSIGVASAVRGEIIAAAPSYNVGLFLDLK